MVACSPNVTTDGCKSTRGETDVCDCAPAANASAIGTRTAIDAIRKSGRMSLSPFGAALGTEDESDRTTGCLQALRG